MRTAKRCVERENGLDYPEIGAHRCAPSGHPALPVELQRDLHAALCIHLSAPETKVRVLNCRAVIQRTKLSPVQEIERLPPDVQAFLFPMEIDTARQRQILVEPRPVAQLGIEPGL